MMISNLPETIDNFDNSVIRKWKPLSLMLIFSNVKNEHHFLTVIKSLCGTSFKIEIVDPPGI